MSLKEGSLGFYVETYNKGKYFNLITIVLFISLEIEKIKDKEKKSYFNETPPSQP